MKKICIVFIFFFVFVSFMSLHAQWAVTFGWTGMENALCVQQTSDGGYILGGYTSSYGAGSYDFWIVKLDADFQYEWEVVYGGTLSDVAYSIQETSDGGYIVAGETVSFGPANGNPEAFMSAFAAANAALKRLPTGSEVAAMCVFLASDQASAVTGQCLNVDCGVFPQ